ncbi:MAG: hypothetical protein ACHQ4F_16730 [Candidatus Dormibacteria bacterium]
MRAAIAIVVSVLLVACGGSLNPAKAPGSNPSLKVGQSTAYNLYIHCGILSVTANGHTYYAEPPLSDGQGNPPPGWGNPYDNGTLKLIDEHTLRFSDANGPVATFTDTPAGATPSIPLCS